MKPFVSIAIPHKDVLEGKLTMDIFAADLWQVFQGKAPEEYQNPEVFFKKTFLTQGLNNLLQVAEKRLQGKGGDPVIQIQTPFGGGKTHSLIALYHKANEWGAKRVIIDGASLDPQERTLWEEIEKQLTGKIERLKGRISPGKEKLQNLIESHQPLLILIDELFEYIARASGVKVENSTLSTQVIAFIQEITGVASILDRTLLVMTLPSSTLEHYGNESAEMLFEQLKKVSGRTEMIYTPVHDREIASVIRHRLFKSVNEGEMKEVVDKFVSYIEKENLLPEGMEKPVYRDRFHQSYPFAPEVIDVLYHRWGSFPTFQRTRGVLRLLALVVYFLKNSKTPFIRLSDFDLSKEGIKRELIKHIGEEYSSIIAKDITASDAGAKVVDKGVGEAYLPYNFGTKAATAIFLYSHSGGQEKGATIKEIKLSSAEIGIPSSIIDTTLNQLEERLFYIWKEGGKLLFKNQANLNQVLVIKKDTIDDLKLKEEEERIVRENVRKDKFEVYIWPEKTKDVPDTRTLKLLIMNSQDEKICQEFIEKCGEKPRVYKNTLIFVVPLEAERLRFKNYLRDKLAWQMVKNDTTLSLTTEQRKSVDENLRRLEKDEFEELRNLYRLVYLPGKDKIKEVDMGKFTVGDIASIDAKVYQYLRGEGDILEKIPAKILKEKYLEGKDYVQTVEILKALLSTPGEIRVGSEEALREGIREGVENGLFGLGELEGNLPKCRWFKEAFNPDLAEGEILIREELCGGKKEGIPNEDFKRFRGEVQNSKTKEEVLKIKEKAGSYNLTEEQRRELEIEIEEKIREIEGKKRKDVYDSIYLPLNVPSGRLSDVVKMINYIKSKFKSVEVKVEIKATEGEITVSDYEDKINEAINQAGIIVEKHGVRPPQPV